MVHRSFLSLLLALGFSWGVSAQVRLIPRIEIGTNLTSMISYNDARTPLNLGYRIGAYADLLMPNGRFYLGSGLMFGSYQGKFPAGSIKDFDALKDTSLSLDSRTLVMPLTLGMYVNPEDRLRLKLDVSLLHSWTLSAKYKTTGDYLEVPALGQNSKGKAALGDLRHIKSRWGLGFSASLEYLLYSLRLGVDFQSGTYYKYMHKNLDFTKDLDSKSGMLGSLSRMLYIGNSSYYLTLGIRL